MHLGSVLELAQRGRGTRRPDTEPPICFKNRWKQLQNHRQMTSTSCEESMQASFKESGWALNALVHLLQHPNLRHRIKALVVETVLGGLSKPLTLMDDPRVILEPLEER